jgi:hypothetical protein
LKICKISFFFYFPSEKILSDRKNVSFLQNKNIY